MSEEHETSSRVSAPRWDGEVGTAAMYLFKIESYIGCHNSEDVLEESIMSACPTKSEYLALVAKTTKDTRDKEYISLYKKNARMMATIAMGQDSDLGVSMVKHTKTADHPNGLVWQFIEAMTAEYTPCDAAAEIMCDAELKKVQFKSAKVYYKEVVGITSRYKHTVTEKELVKNLSMKVDNTAYMKMIVDHLKSGTINLKVICDEIDSVQSLVQVHKGTKSNNNNSGKEVQLANHDGKRTCHKCGKDDHIKKDCPQLKKGGKGPCNHCGQAGHNEAACWKKHPELAPKGYADRMAKKAAKKRAAEKTEAYGLSMESEIHLPHIDYEDTQDFRETRL